MSYRPLPHEPLGQLLSTLIDGQLSAEQNEQLVELLREDRRARQYYVRLMAAHAQLITEHVSLPTFAATDTAADSAQPAAESSDSESPPAESSAHAPTPQNASVLRQTGRATAEWIDWRIHPGRFLSVAIALTLLIWLGLYGMVGPAYWSRVNKETAVFDDSTSPSIVAEIVAFHECRWHTPESRPQGRFLREGATLKLAEGIVTLRFRTGAALVLEGPANFEVSGRQSTQLDRGKLTVSLPDGLSGFVVCTPVARITDLGTEFGVEVQEDGQTEVHVFKGRVETELLAQVDPQSSDPSTNKPTGQKVVLLAGEAAQVTQAASAIIHVPSVPKKFAGMFRHGPFPLVGFYPFDNSTRDASLAEAHPIGAEGIQFAEGKESRAASFRKDRRSYIDIPIDVNEKKMPQMTWGAWVRPRSVGPSYNEILSSDNMGYDRMLTIDARVGNQETKPRELRFAAFLGTGGVLSSRGPLPKVGRWTFVAAVHDGTNRTVSLYVEDPSRNDGRGGLVRDTVEDVQFGECNPFVRIGGHATAPQPFDGEIDNVFIFSAALSAAQLEQIRSQGKSGILAIASGQSAEGESVETSPAPGAE